MSDLVHYLIKNPSAVGGLIYPNENSNIVGEGYVGFGGFYLLGTAGASISGSYRFIAIRNKHLIETKMNVYQDSRNYFMVDLTEVGRFLFFAQPIPKGSNYVGRHPAVRNLVALKRLRSWRPNDLELACKRHNFYFIGYTPRINLEGNQLTTG